MNDERRGHGTSDDTLRRALSAASPEPPLDAVDWDALHGWVMAQAPKILARSAARRAWWDVTAAWAARGIPVTAASAAAAVVVLALVGAPTAARLAEYETIASLPTTLEAELAADAAMLIDDETGDDELAWALLVYEGEEP